MKNVSKKFSSGPTRKFSTWSLLDFNCSLLGRSHRSYLCKEHIKSVIELTKKLLEVPEDYRLAIIPGSATGAIESALWSLLGKVSITAHCFDVFSYEWAYDIEHQLKLPFFKKVFDPLKSMEYVDENPKNDLVITLNGTTTGVYYKDLSWIQDNRDGLVIADATSAAFCVPIQWEKLDAIAFSWQKGLGGEGAHGILVLSPKAVKRIEEYTPSWPIPRLFRLTTSPNVLNEKLFEGDTLNTPSMLCIDDCFHALKWMQNLGMKNVYQKCQDNFSVLKRFVEQSPDWSFSNSDINIVSPSSPCLRYNPLREKTFDEQWTIYRSIAAYLEKNHHVFDILNHSRSFPGIRIWCGPTIEKEDLEEVMAYLHKATNGI